MQLKEVSNRVIVRVDMNEKNSHRFEDGTVIKLERAYNNFNMRYTQAVQGKVISAEHIPEGATVLFHHNSVHDVNRIFNYGTISGEEIASDIRYYSVPVEECYLFHVEHKIKADKNKTVELPNEYKKHFNRSDFEFNEWQPCKGFATALRIFEPYKGIIEGVEPTEIKNKLWITSGEYKERCAMTLRACDYEIIFQDNGREERLIRVRHWEDEEEHEREEIVAIDDTTTDKILNGELLVGLNKSDCKQINKLCYAGDTN